jgi:hypothetical protein
MAGGRNHENVVAIVAAGLIVVKDTCIKGVV